MRTLLLLRHAKSSWDDASLADFDRPLAGRGERDAPRMGKALRKLGIVPDFILSSPAQRARQTVEAFAKGAKLGVEPQFDEAIYLASSSELMKLIRGLPESSQCALLVGHNPGFEDTVFRLLGSGCGMPTAALACITFEVDRWEDIEDGAGSLQLHLTPKTLKGGGKQ